MILQTSDYRTISVDTNVLKTSSGGLKMSWRLITKPDFVRTSEKIVGFSNSWRLLIYIVLKTYNLRRLGDIWFTTSWGQPIYDVLKTPDLRRLEDVSFTTSWRRPIYDVLKTYLKQSLGSKVVLTSIQRRMKRFYLLLNCLKNTKSFKCSCLG